MPTDVRCPGGEPYFYEGPGSFKAFAQAAGRAAGVELPGLREFAAATETPGHVIVTSTDPPESEVVLESLMDNAGQSQTFRAGFRCNPEP